MAANDWAQESILQGNTGNWLEDDHGAVVYVIAPDENGPSKIGVSMNIGRRLANLQVGCWMPLAVFSTRICFKRFDGTLVSLWGQMDSGARYVEAKTHAKLKDCDAHLHGEWFDVSVAEAIQAVEKTAKLENAAAITLEQLCEIEVNEHANRLERDTHQTLIKALYQANAFARRSVDKL